MYDTDETMRKLWISLLGDFRANLGWPTFCEGQCSMLNDSLKGFRNLEWPAKSQAPVPVFKALYQLENLFKRYRFRDDAYTDEELQKAFEEKFLATQIRLSNPLVVTPVVHRVLQVARRKCREILGTYSSDMHYELSRFGKRACFGVPYRESYLDVKMLRLTGSAGHIKWFREGLLSGDTLLSECVLRSVTTECPTLVMSTVPKSYKALRGIMPNTVLGSVYTAGLGRLLENKLRDAGLDIRRLQEKHRRLAREYSRTRECATADLSAASDSISSELLRWILPARWYHVSMLGRIPYVSLGSTTIRMQTVITMGLGHTFPLQTLIFYCLLYAIAELKGASTRKVSVYGDDLIYPAKMHRIVSYVFSRVGLILNQDKTYVRDNFRESCGGDFYRGCDVRPYQPEGRHGILTRRAYGAFLYGICNGLRRRWDEEEIRSTLEWLYNELYLSQTEVFQVPPSFPDSAGVITQTVKRDARFLAPVWGLQQWAFKYLRAVSKRRFVPFQMPYYWEALRPKDESDEQPSSWDDVADTPQLIWQKTRYAKFVKTSNGKRVRMLTPHVPAKGTSELHIQSGVISEWR